VGFSAIVSTGSKLDVGWGDLISSRGSRSRVRHSAENKDPHTGERRIIPVGRLNKLHASNEAEAAVLVSDQYQKLGLGKELFRRVVDIARDEKLSQVSAEVLPDNLAMQVIMKRLGFRLRRSEDLTTIRAYLDL
jgi:acetyltransferase